MKWLENRHTGDRRTGSICSCLKTALLALFVSALFYLPWISISHAQSIDQISRSYVTPFPKGGRYKIMVAGASLAQGMYKGLASAFDGDRTIELVSDIKHSSGLARQSGFNWEDELKSVTNKDQVDILVIMLDLKELSHIRSGRESYQVGDEKWREAMGKRVETLLKIVKDRQVAVYWVGLPIMRSPELNEKMQLLNDVFRKHSFISGVKFVDTWNGFADQFGRYSAFGPDINGNVRRMREDDGIHLTERGNRKLAHFIEKEIRRDIALAKSERNIPLAGTREEQARIKKEASNKPRVEKRYTGKPGEGAAAGTQGNEGFFARLQRNFIGGDDREESKDKSDGKVIEGIRIVRPPLSDIALSGSGGRNNPAAVSAVTGDIIADDIGFGLTALASVTSANDLSLKDVKRRLPLKQTPYYRVLVEGEMLKPKPGRADDFAWKQ